MTNPFSTNPLEVTELEERFELTAAGADADKGDDNEINSGGNVTVQR